MHELIRWSSISFRDGNQGVIAFSEALQDESNVKEEV